MRTALADADATEAVEAPVAPEPAPAEPDRAVAAAEVKEAGGRAA